MIVQALVVEKPGDPFVYQDVQLEDTIRDDEVLIEMKATGVCHTDLNFSKETGMPDMFPVVLGHEGAGIVSKIGSKVTNVAEGDHVVVTYNSCGKCKYCANHETSVCNDWFRDNFGIGRGDGSKAYSSAQTGKPITSHFFGQSSFSNHALVGTNCLVKVDKELPLDTLAPLGCGIMTGAGAMLNVAQADKRESVAVVGSGAVGLAALMSLRILPKPPKVIIAVDIVASRLEYAKSRGATHTINSRETPDLKAELMKITDGAGVEAAIDTTGRPDVVETLLKSAAKKGVVVTVGVGKITAEVSINIFETVNNARTYVGCVMGNCYPQEFIPMLIEAWKDGNFPFDEMIKRYAAKDMGSAVKDTLSGQVIKAVLQWS